jgi:hypothetical protein
MVKLPSKGAILALLEVLGHDLGHKPIHVVDSKGTAVRIERGGIGLTPLFHLLKNAIQLVGKALYSVLAASALLFYIQW